MKIVIETFVTIFFITLTVFIASQIISSQIQVNNAKEFHYNAMKGMEDSGLDSAVVAEFIAMASTLGYIMAVDIDGDDVMRCKNCNTTFSVSSGVVVCGNCSSNKIFLEDGNRRGLVTLTYDVEVPLLGITENGRVEGYVR